MARIKLAKGEKPAKSNTTLMTFSEVFEDFRSVKLKGFSATYIESYEYRVRNHTLPHHKDTPIGGITANDILPVGNNRKILAGTTR